MAKKKPFGESNVVVVPKPSAKAYNPERVLDRRSLLLNQVRQFQHVEQGLPAAERVGLEGPVETEGQAAEYLRKMTERMQERGKPRVKKAGAE
jgi:hypothetical protein